MVESNPKSKRERNVFSLSRYKELHDYTPEFLASLKKEDPAAYKFLSDFIAAEYYGYAHHDDNEIWEGMTQDEKRKVYRQQYHRNNDVYHVRCKSMSREDRSRSNEEGFHYEQSRATATINWSEAAMVAACDCDEAGNLPYDVNELIPGHEEKPVKVKKEGVKK